MAVPPRPASAWTRDVAGGQTATSTSSTSPSAAASSRQKASVSVASLNIFQFPAMSISGLRDRENAREFLAFEQLERGAAAGRDPGDPVGEAHLLDRADGVAAADDRVGAGVRHRVGDGLRAVGEARELEDAHRAVPEDRLRGRDDRREALAAARADVEPLPAVRHVEVIDDLQLCVGREAVRDDGVVGKLYVPADGVLLVPLLRHLAADQELVRALAELAQD